MSKIRIHELAKELGTNSKELITKLKDLGIDAKNHMSSVTQEEIGRFKTKFNVETKTENKQGKTEGISMKSEASEPIKQTKEDNVNIPNAGEKSVPVQNSQSVETPTNVPQGDRPAYQGTRPQGDRPAYQGTRPQGDRPAYQGTRPQGDRPAYQGTRPQGDRPAYQGTRPQGDRPAYQGTRPQGDRPAYQGTRPQGDRPPYQGTRPQGDRPAYQGTRPQGDRPAYQGTRPQGDRPAYQGTRPQGDRPVYQGTRPQGDRPAYQGTRPQGDRPAYQGTRPQGDRPAYQGTRPQGDRPAYQGNRPQGSYAGGRPQGGGYSNNGEDRPRTHEKPKEKSGASPIVGKPNVDQVRRLNKSPIKSDKPIVYKNTEKPMQKPILKNIVKLKPEPKPISNEPKIIQIPQVITLKKLAEIMNLAGNDIIKSLIKKGMMITINEEIDFEKASEIAEDYNFLVEEEIEIDLFVKNFFEEPEKEEDLTNRPPVVVVMGHVDHGKTSLLDRIREESVTKGEAGGITQHIGAYTVRAKGKPITFLDTPGHAAFTAMRMRGAKITDIAILVVAADDGVMPQTIEAINHAKAAEVEIIVAINKMDKPSANPDRVKQELVEHGVIVEEFGGETICVPVSAMKNEGLDTLLEMIILVSEMKEYKANSKKKARGTIIEASLDKGRGPVATVLVQSGTLRIGDPIVANNCFGKIRAMTDDKGNSLKKAGPSTPVEILGLSIVPQAGEMFYVAENDKHARHVAEAFVAIGREEMTRASSHKVSLEDLFAQIKDGTVKELNIVIKADVQGSVEAIRQSLEKLNNDEVRIKIIHGGVGAINESDIMLATTSSAIVIGFNVRPEVTAKSIADEQGVDIRLYKVIYNAIEDVEAAMKGMLDPIYEEKITGHAEIRQIFKSSGAGTIGGCFVTDGKIVRNSKARLFRDGAVIYEGAIDALKRFKDDAKEVREGFECGISFNKYNDIKMEDIIEVFMMEKVER